MKIGLLLYPSCLPAGLFAGLDFFKAANLIMGKPVFEASLVSLNSAAVICGHGQTINPQTTVDKFQPDVVIVPGFWSDSPEQTELVINQNKELQSYLNQLSSKRSLWSYCTGVLFHAATGRLDDKGATATWWLARDLLDHFPEVQWDFQDNFIANKLDSTASGANGFYATYEEALKKFANKRVLTEVQKYLMSPPRLELNNPFYQFEMASQPSPLMTKLLRLIQKQPAHQLNLSSIADQLGVSPKTLSRLLKKEVPWTPAHFFRMMKLKQCGDYLINSELSISEICAKFGFEDESNFSRSFKASTKMTPAEYRQKFKRV